MELYVKILLIGNWDTPLTLGHLVSMVYLKVDYLSRLLSTLTLNLSLSISSFIFKVTYKIEKKCTRKIHYNQATKHIYNI
jgi:hypothetical protein